MFLVFRDLFTDRNDYKLFKITVYVAISNIVAILWDIYGLKVEITPFYLSAKFFFVLAPSIIFLNQKLNHEVKCLLVASIYYLYCYYNCIYVSYTYFTAYIQFFALCVFVLNFRPLVFLFSHLIGLSLYLLTLTGLKDQFSPSEYMAQLELINGAVIPAIAISFLIYFYIRHKEQEELIKSSFFRRVGQDVGFILHEIKQPMKSLQSEKSEKNLEEINELLEVSNILWPGKETSFIKETEFDLKELIDSLLEKYKQYSDYINVNIDTIDNVFIVKSNKSILKIVIKNILKNALEEAAGNDCEMNYINICKAKGSNGIVFSNNIRKKVNIKKIQEAGYSTKSNISNRGIGLYICKNLISKLGHKLNITSEKKEFRITITF